MNRNLPTMDTNIADSYVAKPPAPRPVPKPTTNELISALRSGFRK